MRRAVDVESFAGGFTLGAAQAGFHVVAKRELPGGFGVASVEANRTLINPELDIQVSDGPSWVALDDIDVVFGNPPCSAFSGVSDKAFAGAGNAINQCMFELIDYAARCNGGTGPDVVIYESVQNAYRKGLYLLQELHARLVAATGAPYVLHHVLHNAYALGGCAERRRYFWVASRIPIGFASPGLAPSELPTLWDAIGDLYDLPLALEPQPYGPEYGQAPSAWAKAYRSPDGLVDGHVSMPPQYQRQSQALLDAGAWNQGESLSKALERWVREKGSWPTMEDERDERFAAHYGPDGRNYNFGGAWQPERWRHENPARVITGGSSARSIHPFAPRPFTLREQYRIQGFPDNWRLKPAVEAASLGAAMLWPGKGIPVSSGRWVASMAMAALDGNPVDDGKLERVGEAEYVWNGTNDHKPRPVKKRPRESRTSRTTQTTTTTKEQKQMTTETEGALALTIAAFQAGQPAAVQLTGADKAQDKKRRELLYSAAYKLGGKVKVRTDRATKLAVGVFYREGEEPPTATTAATMIDVAAAFVTSGAGTSPHTAVKLEERSAPATDASVAASETPSVYAEGDRHTGHDGTVYELHYRDDNWHWDVVAETPQQTLPVVPVASEPITYERVTGFTDNAPEPQGTLVFDGIETDGVADVPVFETNPVARLMEPIFGPGLLTPETFVNVDAVSEEDADAALCVTETESESVHDLDEERHYDLQPKNSAREVKDRRFDLTQLRASSHGYYVHRDYASHYFRWGWAARQIRQGDTLLEVGCGQDLPLTRVLIYYPGSEMPKAMVSVDLNKIKDHVQPKWFTLYDQTNFLDAQPAIVEAHGRFNVATCFEVIEHMPKEEGEALLERLRDSIVDDGIILLSTPCFNGRAAANHIHEWTVDELSESIEAAGLEVDVRYGTFASYHDVKRGLTELMFSDDGRGIPAEVGGEARQLAADWILGFYERLREFYADDVLANFMAPNLPDHSRNNVWRLRRKAAPASATDLTFARVGANTWTWSCGVCGTLFERTSQESLEGFAPNHLSTCTG